MKFTIKTIGCKVNTYESMKIRDELCKLGLDYIDVEEKEKYDELDFYIVNTCSVTKIADKKSRQMLHLAKKYNKDVIVIAIGCMVDSLYVGEKLADEKFNFKSPLDGVDYIIPNKEKSRLAKFLLSLISEKRNEPIAIGAKFFDDTSNNTLIEDKLSTDRKDISLHPRIRAFIKIQDGCNQYCTYCIIPFLRGNIKSRDNIDILDEVKEKVKQGVKEIVLTGIHLSSFGLDRVNKTYESEGAIKIARKELLTIMLKIAEIDGVKRIRLGSLEPRIINDEFLEVLIGGRSIDEGDNMSYLKEKFCSNFCLSLQSGCDKTLKRMNRHYTTADYENACKLIREFMPYATITTDVIVGFPGETEEDFRESLDFVKRMRFYNPNIFPYSRRQGTKADKMKDQLTNEEKHRRSVIMISECEKISKDLEKEYFERYKDRAKEVLIEEYIEEEGSTYGIGYTKEYIKCKVAN